MKKNVLIQDKDSGKHIATYPINVGYANEADKDIFYFNEAWLCALADGVVNANARSDYVFSFDN